MKKLLIGLLASMFVTLGCNAKSSKKSEGDGSNGLVQSTDQTNLSIDDFTDGTSPETLKILLENSETSCASGQILAFDGVSWRCQNQLTTVPVAAPSGHVLMTSTANAVEWVKGVRSEVTRTINFDPSMSETEIRAAIEGIGEHFPLDVSVTLQFANGTYTFSEALSVGGYFGGGKLIVAGNASDSSNADTKNVVLDFSGAGSHGLRVYNSGIQVDIKNLEIRISTASDYAGIVFSNSPGAGYVTANTVLGNGTATGSGIKAFGGSVINAKNNRIGAVRRALSSSKMSTLVSESNDAIAASPVFYGLTALSATVIKADATQPIGSNSNEFVTFGGQIN